MACRGGIAAVDRRHGGLPVAIGSSSPHNAPHWGDMVMPPLCNAWYGLFHNPLTAVVVRR
jgi:hypothetical protein